MTAPGTFRMPPAPRTIEETGLSADLILQMVTKTLHFAGELVGTTLADRLGVPFQVIEPALELLKRERHCEIVGGAMVGSSSFKYRLTDAGRVRAALFLEDNHYVGALPVPIDQYQAYMGLLGQSGAVSRAAVREAFAHLVLNDRTLDQLGPAIAAWHSLFVYGPPGNGKTVISQAIRNLLHGDMAIPHAVSVEGHIIRVYDPVNHEMVSEYGSDGAGLERAEPVDGRWVRCRRPLVTVGGELTLSALELGYSPLTGFYSAPLQMVANGGVLVIDDFGRQQTSPRDLLNRWIVPLESRVDYMTLQTGQKFHIPFKVFAVFATNLKPGDLVDEAFLRRIQYKVIAESPTLQEFVQIFDNYCRGKQIQYEPGAAEELAGDLRRRGLRLRGCHPRDLIEHALALGRYLDKPPVMTFELLAEASASYFVEDRDLATV
jgi:predicted ATPase with chaperone activity